MSEWLPWLVGLIFSAGALYAGIRIGLRQLRKDLNGAMARSRQDHREISDQEYNLTLALMVVFQERRDREVLFWALRRR